MNKKIRKKIAKSATINNSKLEAKMINIEEKARLVGVCIKAKKIEVGSNVELTNCKIFSDGIVSIGNDSIIKENSIINAFKNIHIGERTIIDRDVTIGGMQSQKSEIKIGNDCVVLYRSYLNTTRKISIGNNVGIGGYCLIFSHSAWQNVLDGNPYKFADVEIKDNAWLPWNVTVMPGIIIGKNATIGSGSVITKQIPPNVFAAGVPARIVKKKNLRGVPLDQKNQMVLEIFADFKDYLSEFLKVPNRTSINGMNYQIITKSNNLVYTTNFKKIKRSDIIVALKIPNKIKLNVDWIELDSQRSKIKTDLAKQFISFIRRYGIKVKNNA